MKFQDLGFYDIQVGLRLKNPKTGDVYEVVAVSNQSIQLRNIRDDSFYGPCSFDFLNNWRVKSKK